MVKRLSLLAVAVLSSCAVGPDYEAPQSELEASFKNAGFQSPPPEGSWWVLFDDPELARLIRMADRNGPTVLNALARYDEARGTLGLARADTFPIVTGDAYARRQSDSGNSNFSSGTYNDYRAAMNLSWEVDLWGRVRRTIDAADANLQAAGYDYQGAILSLRGEVARSYLSLRFADAEIALYEETAAIRSEARRLMKARYDRGASSRIDFERAVTEDEIVKAELAQARAARERFENAIASLTGNSASGFRIAPDEKVPGVPKVPSGVPSDLLRRRPDVAAAERQLAVASETIGITIANYLPKLTLDGGGGVASLRGSDLFKSESKLWSLGPALDVPLFQGGRAFSSTDRAKALYRQALETYRETLLRAVQETEDSLGDSRHLADAARARERAAASAESAANLTRKRYTGGITDYFEVVDSERTALNEQRAYLQTDLARALAATRLIQSLGGGWER